MANVKYFHVAPATPHTNIRTEPLFPPSQGERQQKVHLYNPIFNFDQTFVNSLQSVTPVELGQSVPYVALRLRDMNGEIIEDLNMSFLHKPNDLNRLKQDIRYTDRPTMSLKDITINTDLASGYLYYTNVVLNLRIHAPQELTNSKILLSTLFPGSPLELVYGWNSPNPFLNEKEVLLWAVKSYNINLDETGQVDLQVEGTAFNERLGNTFVGDIGQDITTDLTDPRQFPNLKADKEKLERRIREFKKNTEGKNNYELSKELAEIIQTRESIGRGIISTQFSSDLKKAQEPHLANAKATLGNKASIHEYDAIRFHDLVYAMLNETFAAMGDHFVGGDEFRIIYGNFNAKAGLFKNVSLADFPIPVGNRKISLQRQLTQEFPGQFVLTIERFLNFLIEKYVENDEYWKLLLKESGDEKYVQPDVVVNLTNRLEGRTKVVEIQIIDTKRDLPITTVDLYPEEGELATVSSVEKKVVESGLPLIRVGHANSFIKKMNLAQMTDQYMKAALIERMARDRLEGPRSTVVQSQMLAGRPSTPLHLPFNGAANVLGHIGWRPFRAFFLSFGIYVVDGVYKITSVTHKLSAEGFNTALQFMYH